MSYNQLNKKPGKDIIELMDNDKYSYEKKMEKMCHLLKIGADVNVVKDAKSLLVWAKMKGFDDLVELLRKKNAKEIVLEEENKRVMIAKLDLVDEYGGRIGDKCSWLLSSIAGRYNGYKFFKQRGAR